jgi:hypothetical protein
MWARSSKAREGLLCVCLAAAATVLVVWLAPPGGDLAAHLYQRRLYLSHGLTLWDDYWYAGRYSFIGYSVLYYPLAALLGIKLLTVIEVAVAAGAFALLLEREWGHAARWAGRAFALVWAGVWITGEFPFASGVALGLLALLALQAGRRWTGAALTLLVLAASPVAFVMLGVVLAGVAVARGERRRLDWVPALALAVGAMAELLLLRLFPGGGTLGFPVAEAVFAVAFCLGGIALAWRVPRAAVIRDVLAVYLVVVLATWAIPSGLGHDIARLRLLALPLALLIVALRGWRPLPVVVAAVVLAGAWNIAPLAAGWTRSAADHSSRAAAWTKAVAYLHRHLRPGYRVEGVDTSQHWPAWYLGGEGIPIARGWFRQDDHPFNDLFYRRFSAYDYGIWLRRLGVAYVVLADAPPDSTSREEARLVRGGHAGLKRVLSGPVSVYAFRQPRSIVTGPGRPRPEVLSLRESQLRVHVSRGGTYHLSVRWSPYWHASTGCLTRGPDDILVLRTPAAATVSITFRPDAGDLWRALTGATPACPAS